MTFQSFNLDQRIHAAIPASFLAPTPIQAKAIPVVLDGHDIMGLAQTGTGKTAAFVLPILNRLTSAKSSKPRALIIAPTRELVEQICDSIKLFGAGTQVKVAAIYGGVSLQGQLRSLRRGVDIIVACPGRLLDHMERRTVDLSQIEVLVLDEADHMFDMGFLPPLRKILKALPTEKQTLLFSATMPPDIRNLAHDILRNPTTISVGERAPTKTVKHAIYPVKQDGKTDLLLDILKKLDSGSILIFTRTKHRAKKLSQTVDEAGYNSTSLQGNLSQSRRQAALTGFKQGRYQILVATDIAARGIDVEGVSHVINYDIPDTVEAYTHRIGRTGRAERTGDAFTLVTREDEGMVRAIEKVLNAPIERRFMEGYEKIELNGAKGRTGQSVKRVESRESRHASVDGHDRQTPRRGGRGDRPFPRRGRSGRNRRRDHSGSARQSYGH